MNQYKTLLKDILDNGVLKPRARSGMVETISIFGTRMEFDMKDGFPLLTTKKMYYKALVVELLWFIRGDTNIKYLVSNGCNIWNKDAYRWYVRLVKRNEAGLNPIMRDNKDGTLSMFTFEEFINIITNVDYSLLPVIVGYKLGDLGKVYGHQWRNQNGVDQLAELIDSIKSNHYSRYHILDAWNKADFQEMALPPCHLLYQFDGSRDSSGNKVLNLQMYQRSCDTFLGVPFNIASAALFLHLIAAVCDLKPGKLVWVGGDTHLYVNHLEQANLQLTRDVLPLPELDIPIDCLNSLEDLEELYPWEIKFEGYSSHPAIKAELIVGD